MSVCRFSGIVRVKGCSQVGSKSGKLALSLGLNSGRLVLIWTLAPEQLNEGTLVGVLEVQASGSGSQFESPFVHTSAFADLLSNPKPEEPWDLEDQMSPTKLGGKMSLCVWKRVRIYECIYTYMYTVYIYVYV